MSELKLIIEIKVQTLKNDSCKSVTRAKMTPYKSDAPCKIDVPS